MFKKFSIVIMCIAVLLSFVSCSKDDTHQNDGATSQTENTCANDASQPSKPTEEKKPVFKTEDITRITFYAYYGNGNGSDVSAENMTAIINWLNSFSIGEKVPDVLPPGTNTIYIEIEYSDRSIVKQGMNTTVVDGITYYISGDRSPECYNEIISKTSLT